MVGWSRRNAESAERRRRWWASLTNEEKALESRRMKVEDRVFFYGFAVILLLLCLMLALMPLLEGWSQPQVLALVLAIFPGGLVLTAFISIYKVRQVK